MRRLGNALYWLCCIIAAGYFVFGIVLLWFSLPVQSAADAGYLSYYFLVAMIAWLVGRGCRWLGAKYGA